MEAIHRALAISDSFPSRFPICSPFEVEGFACTYFQARHSDFLLQIHSVEIQFRISGSRNGLSQGTLAEMIKVEHTCLLP